MRRAILVASVACLFVRPATPQSVQAGSSGGADKSSATSASLLAVMHGELARDMQALTKSAQPSQPAPYFLSYDAHDIASIVIVAQQGAILNAEQGHARSADITVRVGEPKLDNTHGTHRKGSMHTVELPLTDDPAAIRRALWWRTNAEYSNALQTYLNVQIEATVHAAEEDRSPDFSQQKAVQAEQPFAIALSIDQRAWEAGSPNILGLSRSSAGHEQCCRYDGFG